MKVQGVKTNEAKPAPAAEKPKAEKSAFDKLLRGKPEEGTTPNPTAGAIPLPPQPAPVMKKDETPGPASADDLRADRVFLAVEQPLLMAGDAAILARRECPLLHANRSNFAVQNLCASG